jgi:hypothetical protein
VQQAPTVDPYVLDFVDLVPVERLSQSRSVGADSGFYQHLVRHDLVSIDELSLLLCARR